MHQAVVLAAALVNQLPGRLRLRVGKYLLHSACLRQRPLVDNGHMGTDLLHHRHLMGDDNHRNAEPLIDILQKRQNRLRRRRIQGTGSLVAQQDLRFHGKGPGDSHTLFLTAGEL